MLRFEFAAFIFGALFVASTPHVCAQDLPRVEALSAPGPASPVGTPVSGQALESYRGRPPPEGPRRAPSRVGGWRAFGGQSFFLLGGGLLTGLAALGADGDTLGPATLGVLVSTAGGAALLGSLARARRWSPRLGDALAGVYPGAVVGALVGGLVATGAEGRLARGLGFGALGGAIVASWLFSRLANPLHGGEERPGRGGRYAGLLWVYVVGAALLALPAAFATGQGELVTVGAAVGGLAGLAHAAVGPGLHF